MSDNLYPIHDRMLSREDKEKLLGQKARVIWLYGLSGSGKSTIALALEKRLHAAGRLSQVLDGDNIRAGLNKGLGFSAEDRSENIRRIAEVAKLYMHTGVIVIASFICPTRALRQLARDIVGSDDFIEAYVHASYETCAKRDPKGLYAKVQSGQVARFTGKDSGFEPPANNDPNVHVLDTEAHDVDFLVDQLFSLLSDLGNQR